MLIRLISFKHIVLLALFVACNDKPSTPAPSPSPDVTVAAGTFDISILSPATDGNSITNSSVISGYCGKPQFPITVVGGGLTIYSVCQNDFTWAAPVSAKNSPGGTINFAVTLRELNLTAGSPTKNRSFIKVDNICQSTTNLTKTFANFGDSGVDGVAIPYKICNATQFSNIRYHADKKFQLAQDIDFGVATLGPIPTVFTGELDGRGFMLKDFIVKDIGGPNISVGLFRYAHGATIKNLTIMNGNVDSSQRLGILAGDWRGSGLLENLTVTGEVKGTAYTGGLIGLGNTSSQLTIRNVKTQITVTGNDFAGGVIGVINTNDGSLIVENSTFNNTVTGQNSIGGFAGSISEDGISATNVTLKSTINSTGVDVGGFIGDVAGGNFTNVKFVGNITTTKDNVDGFVGGLFGQTKGPSVIQGSSVIANIASGSHYAGGLAGRFHSGSISSSFSRGTITLDENSFSSVVSNVGGLVGATQLDTTISQSYSQASINGRAYAVGGLVGVMNGTNSAINESYHSVGTINGYIRLVGGLVGEFKGQSILNSFSRSNINVTNPTASSYVGGLVGFSNNAASTFSRLYYSGTLTITNGFADIVGGLFGYLKANSLKESFLSGTVQGARTRVGGLVGHLVDTQLSASFMSGSVIATLREVGGIAGVVTNGKIEDVFVSGSVQGAGNLGGIAGWLAGTAQINRSYFSGSIGKNAASSEPDAQIGRLIGLKDATANFTSLYYYDLSLNRRLADSSTIPHNGPGSVKTNGQLRNIADYTNFIFTDSALAFDWDIPSAGFKLPFQSLDHFYATPDWLKLANFGFLLPTVWSDDPLSETVISILDSYGGLLGNLTQEEYDEVTNTGAVTTVTQGQLQISIKEPSYDGAPISNTKLIYGECGVPGGVVRITGSFTVNTICQSNYRWAAIIDATNKVMGNHTLTVRLYNQAVTGNSPVVSRILNKNNTICSNTTALNSLFANVSTGGNGTTVPYLICNGSQFRNSGYYPTAKYELANDLDFANAIIEPVKGTFKGQIDGKGFKVRNFKISKPTNLGIGLFESVEDAVLKNITFEKFSVTGYERTGVFAGTWRKTGLIENVVIRNGSVTGITYTGGLIGMSNTTSALTLKNVTTDLLTIQGNNQTGGLIGVVATTDGSFSLKDSTLKSNINGLSLVGGAVGQLLQPSAILQNVTQTGNVTALKTEVGGLIGEAHSGTFTNLTVTGNISTNWPDVDVFVGGIIGHIKENSALTDVQYSGTMTAAGNFVGGIVGRMQVGTITNALTNGAINVSSPTPGSIRNRVGGIIGGSGQTVTAPVVSLPSTLDGISSTMTVNTVATMVGGLVGEFGAPNSSLKNGHYTGSGVTGRTSLIGGAVGFFHGVTLEDTYSTGPVTINQPTPNAYVGGLIGYSNSKVALHKRLWASGLVTAMNGTADYLGGLYGYFRAGTLEDSYATGNVIGGRNSNGGLIGMLRGVVRRSYSTGNVSASLRHNGGLIGYLNIGVPLDPVNFPGINTIDPLIEDSYALGSVTTSGTVATDVSGGLVGYVNTTGLTNRVKNSYTRSTLAKQPSSTLPMSALGTVYGGAFNSNMLDLTSLYFLDTNSSGGQTANGVALTAAQMTSAGNYNFDFLSATGWRMPNTSTNVPGYGTNFPWPTLSWVGVGSTIAQYSVRGSINGLGHSNIKLQLNGGEEITINNGTTTFAFTLKLQTGQSYSVALTQNPTLPDITCTIANGSGFMGNADVTNISVNCPTFQSLAIAGTSNMASGSSQPLAVNATLSNNVIVNVTAQAALSFTGTDFSLTSATLNALNPGTTTVTANFLSLSTNRIFNSVTAPNAPTGVAWQGTSPLAIPTMTSQWVLSSTPGIASQEIRYFLNAGCTGSALTQKTLSASATTDTYTGTDTNTYSFMVSAINSSGISNSSSCSSAMTITLPTPNPVTALTVASSWRNGTLPISSPAYTWTNPGSISGVKVALGSTLGGSEIVNWSNVGLVTGHTFVNLSGLTACAPVYASVRTINSFNKESTVTTAASWAWDNSSPTAPAGLSLSGIASTSVSQVLSWTPSTDNCQLSQYQIALGTSAGGADVINWTNIGSVTSFQATSGAGGLNFTLAEGTDYYLSVRATDAAGNISTTSTSAAWQIPSTGLAKYMWYDGQSHIDLKDRAGLTPDDGGFSGRIYQWLSRGTTAGYDLSGATTTADPSFDIANDHVAFNGTNQYLNIPGGTAFDNGTFQTKNMFISFKTSNDLSTRQVIFEQGDRVRGMNLYILSNKLYCAFWNTTNDGDGAQAIVSQNISIAANSIYHAALILDYSNYTNATGPNGVFKCILNGTQIGTNMSTTSRLFPSTGGAAFGAMRSGTRFHDTSSTATGNYFAGRIMEAFSLTSAPSPSSITSLLNAQMSKWTGGELSAPSNLMITNNSSISPMKAAKASWQPIVSNHFVTDHYEMAVGTSAEGTETLYWSNIGNVTTYEAFDGFGGLAFTLIYGVDYYLSIKAVDTFGNESLVVTSNPWQVYPSSSLQLSGTFLKLDGSDRINILDGANINAATGGFAGVVATWRNTINNAVNTFTQATATARAAYSAPSDAVRFDQVNDSLSTPSETNITNSIATQKAVTVVFTSGADITTRQFLYEQGSRNNRGMAIYIQDGNLYCLFHNSRNDGDGTQVPVYQTVPISAGQSYVVTNYLDYRNYTNATGPTGTTGCYVNGVLQGTGQTTSRLYGDNSAVFIGVRSSATWHNSNANGIGDYFGGDILEVQVSNQVPTTGQSYIDFHNALMNKWQ